MKKILRISPGDHLEPEARWQTTVQRDSGNLRDLIPYKLNLFPNSRPSLDETDRDRVSFYLLDKQQGFGFINACPLYGTWMLGNLADHSGSIVLSSWAAKIKSFPTSGLEPELLEWGAKCPSRLDYVGLDIVPSDCCFIGIPRNHQS